MKTNVEEIGEAVTSVFAAKIQESSYSPTATKSSAAADEDDLEGVVVVVVLLRFLFVIGEIPQFLSIRDLRNRKEDRKIEPTIETIIKGNQKCPSISIFFFTPSLALLIDQTISLSLVQCLKQFSPD